MSCLANQQPLINELVGPNAFFYLYVDQATEGHSGKSLDVGGKLRGFLTYKPSITGSSTSGCGPIKAGGVASGGANGADWRRQPSP